jgi:hypothetical protein
VSVCIAYPGNAGLLDKLPGTGRHATTARGISAAFWATNLSNQWSSLKT